MIADACAFVQRRHIGPRSAARFLTGRGSTLAQAQNEGEPLQRLAFVGEGFRTGITSSQPLQQKLPA